MGHPVPQLTVPCYTRSGDGRLQGQYPYGNFSQIGFTAQQQQQSSIILSTGGLAFAPNLPSGMTALVDRQWNPTDPAIPGGVLPPASLTGTDSFHMSWFGGSPSVLPTIATPASISAAIGQTVPALPDGNPTCLAIKYPSGFPSGQVPFEVAYTNTITPALRMYVCCYVFMPVGFNSNGNNIKWVFYQQDGNANHVFMLSSFGTDDYRGAWMATQGGGGSHSYGSTFSAAGAIQKLPDPPPQGTGPGWWLSQEGAWHCLEWFVQRETVPGVSANGIFQSWFDNVEINHWANINFNATTGDSNGFQGCSFEPFYGGGGSSAPSDQHLCVGRFYSATGN